MDIFLQGFIRESRVSETERTLEVDPAEFLRELRQHIVSVAGAARLAKDLDDAVLNGEHRFERQQSSCKCSRCGNPPAQFEIFQSVENSEHMGVFFLLFDRRINLRSAHALIAHLHGSLHYNGLRDAELLCVDDKDISLKFLRCNARALEGTGNPGGKAEAYNLISGLHRFFKVAAVLKGRDLARLGNLVGLDQPLVKFAVGKRNAI